MADPTTPPSVTIATPETVVPAQPEKVLPASTITIAPPTAVQVTTLLISNWLILCSGIGGLMIALGWLGGKITTADLEGLMTALFGIHLGVSGVSRVIGGLVAPPTVTINPKP